MKIPFLRSQPKTVVVDVPPEDRPVHWDLGTPLVETTPVVIPTLRANPTLSGRTPTAPNPVLAEVLTPSPKRRGADGRFLPKGM